MKIPKDHLEDTINSLRYLVDERTSAPWASYSEDELDMDDQDIGDAEGVRTVLDVVKWLRDQGGRTDLIEYSSCMDPLGKFDEENVPDEIDAEVYFRQYLVDTYNIDPKEFPSR